jgi:hypothetical protein
MNCKMLPRLERWFHRLSVDGTRQVPMSELPTCPSFPFVRHSRAGGNPVITRTPVDSRLLGKNYLAWLMALAWLIGLACPMGGPWGHPSKASLRRRDRQLSIFQKVFESDFSDRRINLPRNDHRSMRLLFHDFANVKLFVPLALLQKWIGK